MTPTATYLNTLLIIIFHRGRYCNFLSFPVEIFPCSSVADDVSLWSSGLYFLDLYGRRTPAIKLAKLQDKTTSEQNRTTLLTSRDLNTSSHQNKLVS